MGAPSADVTRRMFDESKRHVQTVTQQGSVVVDADQNDSQESFYTQIRRLIESAVGPSGASGPGMKIEELPAADNDFTIKGGTPKDPAQFFIAGHQTRLIADETYRAGTEATTAPSTGLTELVLTDNSAFLDAGVVVGRFLMPKVSVPANTYQIVSVTTNTLTVIGGSEMLSDGAAAGDDYKILPSTPVASDRVDMVILDAYLDEVDPSEDNDLFHTIGTTTLEADRRLQLRQTVSVFEGTDLAQFAAIVAGLEDVNGVIVDSVGNTHHLVAIAQLNRVDGDATIPDAQIVDLRTIITKLTDVGAQFVDVAGDTMTGALNMVAANVNLTGGAVVTGTDVIDTPQIKAKAVTQDKIGDDHLLDDADVVQAPSVPVHDGRYIPKNKFSTLFGQNLIVNGDFGVQVQSPNGVPAPAGWTTNFPSPLPGSGSTNNGGNNNDLLLIHDTGCFCCCCSGINVLMRIGANVQFVMVMEQRRKVCKGGFFGLSYDVCVISGADGIAGGTPQSIIPIFEIQAFNAGQHTGTLRQCFFDENGDLVRINSTTGNHLLNRLFQVDAGADEIAIRIGFIVEPHEGPTGPECQLTQDLDVGICEVGLHKFGKQCGLISLDDAEGPTPTPLFPPILPPILIPPVFGPPMLCTSEKTPQIAWLDSLEPDYITATVDDVDAIIDVRGPAEYPKKLRRYESRLSGAFTAPPTAPFSVIYDASTINFQSRGPELVFEQELNIPQPALRIDVDGPTCRAEPPGAPTPGFLELVGTGARLHFAETPGDLIQAIGKDFLAGTTPANLDFSRPGDNEVNPESILRLTLESVTRHEYRLDFLLYDVNANIARIPFERRPDLVAPVVRQQRLGCALVFGKFDWSSIARMEMYFEFDVNGTSPGNIDIDDIEILNSDTGLTVIDAFGAGLAGWTFIPRRTYLTDDIHRADCVPFLRDTASLRVVGFDDKPFPVSPDKDYTLAVADAEHLIPTKFYVVDIEVTNVDAGGAALSGAVVTATGNDASTVVVTTDSSGVAVLTGLKPTITYTVTVVSGARFPTVAVEFDGPQRAANLPLTVPMQVANPGAIPTIGQTPLRATYNTGSGRLITDGSGQSRNVKFAHVNFSSAIAATIETACKNVIEHNMHLVDGPCQQDEVPASILNYPDPISCCPFTLATVAYLIPDSVFDLNANFPTWVPFDGLKGLPSSIGRTLKVTYLDAAIAGAWKEASIAQIAILGGGRVSTFGDPNNPQSGPVGVPTFTDPTFGVLPIYVQAWAGAGITQGPGGVGDREAPISSDTVITATDASVVLPVADAFIDRFASGQDVWVRNSRLTNGRPINKCDLDLATTQDIAGIYGTITALDAPANTITVTFAELAADTFTLATARDAEIIVSPNEARAFYGQPSAGMVGVGNVQANPIDQRSACIQWEISFWEAFQQGSRCEDSDAAILCTNGVNGQEQYPYFGFTGMKLDEVDFRCFPVSAPTDFHKASTDLAGVFARETFDTVGNVWVGGESMNVAFVFDDPTCTDVSANFIFREGIEFNQDATATLSRDALLTAMLASPLTSHLAFTAAGAIGIEVTSLFWGSNMAITLTPVDAGAANWGNFGSTAGVDLTTIPVTALETGDLVAGDCVKLIAEDLLAGFTTTVASTDVGANEIILAEPVPPCTPDDLPIAGYLVANDALIFPCVTKAFRGLPIVQKFDTLANAITVGIFNPVDGVNKYPGVNLEDLEEAGAGVIPWPIPLPIGPQPAGASPNDPLLANLVLWIPSLGALFFTPNFCGRVEATLVELNRRMALPEQSVGYRATFTEVDESDTIESGFSPAVTVVDAGAKIPT